MNVKKLSIATLALFSALAATAGGASAGGKHHHFHGKHFHHGHGLRIVIGGGGYGGGGCGFYREMWEDTGSFKWKRRYYMCKGWW